MLLEGKVAMISGIGPGLGRGIAIAAAKAGADVALGARRDVHLQTVAAEVEALGRKAVWRKTDVTSKDDCVALAEAAASELGGIDIVVNSAAGADGTLFEEGQLEGWRSAMDITLFGSLQFTHAALPWLERSSDGRVVNIGTTSTRVIEPRQGGYAASNAALLSATKTMAKELGPKGIRVNAVNPGYIQGEPIQAHFRYKAKTLGGEAADYEREIVERNALRYIPEPEEIAGSVVYLASSLSRPVTGHVIECNAGFFIS